MKQARDAKGRRLEIVEIDVLPYTPEANGLRMPVPYVNYYVVNDALIVPMLGGPEDETAKPILEGLYPDRTVVPVESTAIAWDGGGVGCITQRQPAGRPAR